MPNVDLAGNILYVQDIRTGYGQPGRTANTLQTVAAGGTETITRSGHLGKVVLLDTLSGSVCTLPASSGSGDTYKFYVSVAPTSNSHIVRVANATDVFKGWVSTATTTEATSEEEAASGTDDTITLNGTTTGGIAGSYIEVTDITSGVWLIEARLIGSGTLTTPLSATVS